jgi:hypothetical protein
MSTLVDTLLEQGLMQVDKPGLGLKTEGLEPMYSGQAVGSKKGPGEWIFSSCALEKSSTTQCSNR